MRKENRRHGLYLKIGVKKIVRLCFGDETREGSNECWGGGKMESLLHYSYNQ